MTVYVLVLAGSLELSRVEAVPSSSATVGDSIRIESILTVIFEPGLALKNSLYKAAIALRPFTEFEPILYSPSSVHSAATASALPRSYASTNSLAVWRIAFSSPDATFAAEHSQTAAIASDAATKTRTKHI